MSHGNRMAAGGGPVVGGIGGVGGTGNVSGVSVGRGGSGGFRAGARRHALLPLRVFLGVTFIYAGIDKLTNSEFLANSGQGSLGELMRSVRDSSAIPAMVDLALKNPVGFGYAIAIGEMVVGLGVLVGLLGRLAALGGALISLSLWLTVSWATDPYYYGNDLAYLMAWLPLVLAGAATFSLDALMVRRRERRAAGPYGNVY